MPKKTKKSRDTSTVNIILGVVAIAVYAVLVFYSKKMADVCFVSDMQWASIALVALSTAIAAVVAQITRIITKRESA